MELKKLYKLPESDEILSLTKIEPSGLHVFHLARPDGTLIEKLKGKFNQPLPTMRLIRYRIAELVEYQPEQQNIIMNEKFETA